jgi:glycosyltransferase involved in cell wall biosynthesis
MAELLDDTSGRLAPADDVVALAAAVAEARTLDRRACRARVEAIASLDRMLDGYERIFAEVAA